MERIPILKLGNFLLVTIQVDMHDRLALTLQEDLTEKIVSSGARGVLIDISALEIVDSFIGRMLAGIAGMAKILDAETVVVGMQPAVAITLVELGLSLQGIRTALNVDEEAWTCSKPLRLMKTPGRFFRPKRRKLSAVVLNYETHQIHSENDIVSIRQAVRRFTLDAKFGVVDQTKIITAASELARNALTSRQRWDC